MARRRTAAALSVVLIAALAVVAPRPAGAASLVEVTGFGSNPGSLRMFRYVPDGLPSNAPLVVVLHGCGSSAAAYDDESGWTKVADASGFALVLPQQQGANNPSLCFNWFQSGDQTRDQGEALSIRQMVDAMKTSHSIDAARVFVTGISAGGAMTNVMLAAYPDVFAGGAPVAGIPHRCATSASEAGACGNPGVDKTPAQWGDLVRGSSSWSGPWPKVTIWQGDADSVVAPMNLTETMEQWTNVHGIDQTPDATDTFRGYPRKQYRDGDGVTQVETVSITGMGHAQPLDPGAAANQCGVTGSFLEDVNVCAAYYMAQFWGIGTGSPPAAVSADNSEANDGYVKAFSNGSFAQVGTLSTLAVGRGTDSRYSRTVLSFDTSALPDAATITRAWILVQLSAVSGNPWQDPPGNTLVIDVNNGCFGACTIEASDWSASPTASATGSIPSFFSGAMTSSDLDAAGRNAISKTGTTQLKLRFAMNQWGANAVLLQSGATAKLVVEYA